MKKKQETEIKCKELAFCMAVINNIAVPLVELFLIEFRQLTYLKNIFLFFFFLYNAIVKIKYE